MYLVFQLLASLSLISSGLSKCYDPSPAFPVPLWTSGQDSLRPAFESIDTAIQSLIGDSKYDASSYSIELTSNTDTLWSAFHTAKKQSAERPGVKHVDADSLYRVASITKTFTTLGILHLQKAGNLSLDDPVDKYITELAGSDSGELPWKDITLRVLASQLSGIPREFAQSDLIKGRLDPTQLGLPPATKEELPPCYAHANYTPCSRREMLDNLKTKKPIFAPGFKSTYSNVAFNLLGLVIESVTGSSYSDYIREAIFNPLDMNSSALETPSDRHAVLPDIDFNYWDIEEGVQAPTGGIYSSSSDMSKFVRYILTHYNALATGVNWLNPGSWSGGLQSFYGMPFETFRTDAILKQSRRPVTFVTKSGGVPGYFSRISIMPEYGLGLTILTAGEDAGLLQELQEMVTVPLIQVAEDAIWKDVESTYSGSYIATNHSLDSSITLAVSPSTGLTLTSFVSNGTDVFKTLFPKLAGGEDKWHVQLTPTLLYKNETAQRGEIWRFVVVPERSGKLNVWDEFCVTDIDPVAYAGLPVNEVVFWHEDGLMELPAWKVMMEMDGGKETLVVQDL